MLQSSPLKSLSATQRLALAVVAIVILFLLIGTFFDSSSPEPAFSFGLQTESFLVLAILSFAGGVLSFASPCTLPILPAYFAFAFQSGRKQIAANTLAFMLGLGTMFSLLGAGASAIGRVLNQNSDLLLLVGGSAILVFGLMSLLGKGFSGFVEQEGDQNTGLAGSYAFGLTFAVGWTSCTGPILGAVLTLAATTGSVTRGIMLLFIYTLGLGLPLLLVSTLFGRASRKSLFWRLLRGRGWTVHVSRLLLGGLWALVIWRILVAVANVALSDFHTLTARPLTPLQEYGLLAVALVGVVLWIATSANKGRVTLQLHSTQLVSGLLFMLLGFFMISGILTYFNRLIPPDLAVWFADIEDALITFFSGV
ncbi:MAG: cytochrome c biogenesis CcdA family protein [Chloroflexota bacterium]